MKNPTDFGKTLEIYYEMTCPQHKPSVLASFRVQFWVLRFFFLRIFAPRR